MIPTWNAWDMLEETLAALQPGIELARKDIEVIVVDDGGDDETTEIVKKSYADWVRLVRREKNGGFSAACNAGIAAATGEWILLLNNDMKPHENAVASLLECAESCDQDVFAIRPAIMRTQWRTAEEYAHMAMQFKFKRGFLHCPIVGISESTAATEAFPVCSGGAGIFRRSMMEELNGFDEIFSPFYWEDTDLSYRALIRGWRNLYHPSALFCHAKKGSIQRSFKSTRVERIARRNAYLFLWLNLSDPIKLAYHFLWLPFQILTGFVPGQQWRLLAFVDAIFRLNKVVRGRLRRKSARKVSDRDIIERSCRGNVVKIWVG